MLSQILTLYIQSLLITTVLVGIFSGLWITFRAMRKKDKTAKERQAHLYDVLMIAIMIIPILTFAMIGLLLVLKV